MSGQLKAFAKLFGTNGNQVLVELGRHPEDLNPCVRIAFQFPDDETGLGVCEMRVNFEDTDSGWDSAEKAFEAMDEGRARKNVAKQVEFASRALELEGKKKP